MEIEYVKEFLMLVKFENYVVAAEELFISQSSLSKHIMTLEKELGYPLLNRTTRKVRISQFGKLFLPYALRIVEANNEFVDKAALAANGASSAIRFGVLPAFISYHAESAVLEFKKLFPNSSVSLVEGSNTMLREKLVDCSCNIILIRTYKDLLPDSFTAIPLLRDNLVLVVPRGKVFPKEKTTITIKELADMELISSASAMQAKILEDCSEGIPLNIIARLSRSVSIVDMLRKGAADGAILNRLASEPLQTDGSLQLIDIEPPVVTLVSLVYKKEEPMTPVFRTFIDTVTDYVARGEFRNA